MFTKKILSVSAIVLAITASLGLSACGGGGSDTSTPADSSGSASVTALKVTDTVVGTGVAADKDKTASVNYTGWLYDSKAEGNKGNKFESNSYTFVVGAGKVIQGWDQGVIGMKVGGKRTLIIPASLAYGSNAYGPIPANAALVFDIELLSVK